MNQKAVELLKTLGLEDVMEKKSIEIIRRTAAKSGNRKSLD